MMRLPFTVGGCHSLSSYTQRMFGVISCNKGTRKKKKKKKKKKGIGGEDLTGIVCHFGYVGNDFHIVFGSVYGCISTPLGH